jgi:hypothetical protein
MYLQGPGKTTIFLFLIYRNFVTGCKRDGDGTKYWYIIQQAAEWNGLKFPTFHCSMNPVLENQNC